MNGTEKNIQSETEKRPASDNIYFKDILKSITDDIEIILWFITWLFMWILFVFAPIGVILVFISFFFETFSQQIFFCGLNEEISVKIIILLFEMMLTLAAFLYVFKYRKIISDRRDLKYIFLSVVIFFIFTGSYYNNVRYRKLMDKIDLMSATIKCYDSDTKASLPITFHYPNIYKNIPFPKTTSIGLADNSMTLNIINFTDTKVEVSSDGYEKKELIIDKRHDNYDVYLKKVALPQKTEVNQ